MSKELRSISTTSKKVNLIGFLCCLLLLASIFLLLPSTNPILWILAFFAILSYWLITYLFRSYADFELNDFNLVINLYTKVLETTSENIILISEIRGFEITETRKGYRSLFIYLKNFNTINYSINKAEDKIRIEEFFSQNFNKIEKNSNPNFSNFKLAYWFVLKRCFLYLLVCLPISFYIFTSIQSGNIFYNIRWLGFVAVLIVSISAWYFIINRPIRHNHFRFLAFSWFSNFIFYLSPFLLFFIVDIESDKNTEPLTLQSPHEITEKPSHQLYLITNISYNPSKVVVSNYYVGKAKRRSMKFPVEHYFLTPITEDKLINDSTSYSFWLAKTYLQRIYKREDENEKLRLSQNFHESKKADFIKLFESKPLFYKPMFGDEKAYRTLAGHKNSANYNIILEPHWETLEDYRNNLSVTLFWLVVSLFGVNILWCLFIASNR